MSVRVRHREALLPQSLRNKVGYLGESPMPLNETFAKAIVFIVGEYEQDGTTKVAVVGTGSIISYPFSDPETKRRFLYIVTSAHVVRPLIRSWVQINQRDGETARIPVSVWYEHPSNDYADDVAVVPAGGLNPAVFDYAVIQYEEFIEENLRPVLGARVYFLGLLGFIPEMSDRNVPMVRSGVIGAVSQPGVPIEIAPHTVIKVTAHLIDCRSFQGFSGSPCFLQTDGLGVFDGGEGASIGWSATTVLIGLLIAHFDVDRPATKTGELAGITGDVAVPVNTGVGVVLPAEKIREVLNQPVLAEDRKLREERAKKQEEEQQIAATPDSLSTDPETAN